MEPEVPKEQAQHPTFGGRSPISGNSRDPLRTSPACYIVEPPVSPLGPHDLSSIGGIFTDFVLGADTHHVTTKHVTSTATSAVPVTGAPGHTDTTFPMPGQCLTPALKLTHCKGLPDNPLLTSTSPLLPAGWQVTLMTQNKLAEGGERASQILCGPQDEDTEIVRL